MMFKLMVLAVLITFCACNHKIRDNKSHRHKIRNDSTPNIFYIEGDKLIAASNNDVKHINRIKNDLEVDPYQDLEKSKRKSSYKRIYKPFPVTKPEINKKMI
nr:uncharacterized protein LOC111418696 [Onthophagus taurus]